MTTKNNSNSSAKLMTILPNGMISYYDNNTCKVAVSWCLLRENIKSYN